MPNQANTTVGACDPTKPMPPDEFEWRMRQTLARYSDDPEAFHIIADKLICRTLMDLGYGHGVAVFQTARKFYA